MSAHCSGHLLQETRVPKMPICHSLRIQIIAATVIGTSNCLTMAAVFMAQATLTR